VMELTKEKCWKLRRWVYIVAIKKKKTSDGGCTCLWARSWNSTSFVRSFLVGKKSSRVKKKENRKFIAMVIFFFNVKITVVF
jgi:hypothetical protein